MKIQRTWNVLKSEVLQKLLIWNFINVSNFILLERFGLWLPLRRFGIPNLYKSLKYQTFVKAFVLSSLQRLRLWKFWSGLEFGELEKASNFEGLHEHGIWNFWMAVYRHVKQSFMISLYTLKMLSVYKPAVFIAIERHDLNSTVHGWFDINWQSKNDFRSSRQRSLKNSLTCLNESFRLIC